tara:strand:- start:118 stop:534 length:417 start_codon:yes stop_codon:yes gene_type:complete
MIFRFLIFKLALLFTSSSVLAENLTIEMTSNRSFSVEIAKIDVGQTIEWLPTAKGHNVEFRLGPDAAKLPKKSSFSKPISIKFDTPGTYFYWCTPHKNSGMIGLVVVGGDTSNIDKIAELDLAGMSSSKLAKLITELN